nr:odorant receptor 59 [Graphosoma rubrolineatum]
MKDNAKPYFVDREVVYDFDKEREIQMIMSCYKISNTSKLKRYISLLCVSILWLFLLYEMCLGFYSIPFTITTDSKTQMLETLHMALLTFYAISHLSLRLRSDFTPVLEIINKGFNTAKKYIENLYKNKPSDKSINPYFPIPFYAPFDTTSVGTFTVVYLFNVVVMYSICMVTICIDEICISLIEQLKAQFEILNLSISNVVERSLQRYLNGKVVPKPNLESLYKQKEFQDCLFKCLRENIRHHHVLLRFTGLIRNYIQITFFLVAMLSSLVLALAVLFITKSKSSDEELLGVGTFVIMLLTELVFTLQFCLYGQEISNESGRIFFTLWSTPWWCFDKRVKSVLFIMMLNTKKPITLKTTFLNVSMSLESFSNIISSAYQVGNVMVNLQ